MDQEKHTITAIGWDVGGWMGSSHGIAVMKINKGKLTWAMEPAEYTLPAGELWTPLDMARGALAEEDLAATRIVIGIDAPLSFPAALTRFLNGNFTLPGKPAKEIENPLAYRDAERYIQRQFRKKPLSAAFDRIGNNATVAMSHVRTWEREWGFTARPFESKKSFKEIIEVYPALVKKTSSASAIPFIHSIIPETAAPGTDAYDACICALHAAAFALDGEHFPRLVHPPEGGIWQQEGWIYHFPPEEVIFQS
ncbi:DUF429 domain-containing protein [Alteribacter natronophilus]|uniref:DUF429 domain-containing protein n=1 Tax=Alteribacter natronophilus TaxID=2583810 RepID=UPI00110E86B4|nr:DUF429 domain-containing protein [Alteribacter natronophilus]TMW73428.1 DUF429 domain-containing protein [Alteribacter natronophilus]